MNLFVIILIETLDFQFPTEMNPFNVLVSVIHETESKIHKAVNAKEAELTKERKGIIMHQYSLPWLYKFMLHCKNEWVILTLIWLHEFQFLQRRI